MLEKKHTADRVVFVW